MLLLISSPWPFHPPRPLKRWAPVRPDTTPTAIIACRRHPPATPFSNGQLVRLATTPTAATAWPQPMRPQPSPKMGPAHQDTTPMAATASKVSSQPMPCCRRRPLKRWGLVRPDTTPMATTACPPALHGLPCSSVPAVWIQHQRRLLPGVQELCQARHFQIRSRPSGYNTNGNYCSKTRAILKSQQLRPLICVEGHRSISRRLGLLPRARRWPPRCCGPDHRAGVWCDH